MTRIKITEDLHNLEIERNLNSCQIKDALILIQELQVKALQNHEDTFCYQTQTTSELFKPAFERALETTGYEFNLRSEFSKPLAHYTIYFYEYRLRTKWP